MSVNEMGDRCLQNMKCIFADAQHKKKSIGTLLNRLRQLHEKTNSKNFIQSFCACLHVPLSAIGKGVAVELTLHFVAEFILHIICKVNSEQQQQGVEETTSSIFLHKVFSFLVKLGGDPSSDTRIHTCQLIHHITSLAKDETLDDDICDIIVSFLLKRLKDKLSTVREAAAIALGRFQDWSDPNCPVTKDYCYHMSMDPSHLVRSAVARFLHISSSNGITNILERTCDVHATVRLAAYERLFDIQVQSLTIKQRLQLIERGLKDDSECVQGFVTNQLFSVWLPAYSNCFVDFLKALDTELSLDTSLLALNSIFRSHGPSLIRAMAELKDLLHFDKMIPQRDLIPENAFLWRVVIKYLWTNSSSDSNNNVGEDLLEAVQPQLHEFTRYLEEYFGTFSSGDDAEEAHRKTFILQELLLICENFDFADEFGRASLRTCCVTLLAEERFPESLISRVVNLMVQVVPRCEARLEFLTEVVFEVFDRYIDEDQDGDDAQKENEKILLSNQLKDAKLRVRIHEAVYEQEKAISAKNFVLANEIQDEINLLEEERVEMQPAAVKLSIEEIKKKNLAVLMRSLNISIEMMDHQSVTKLTPPLRSIYEQVILRCLQLRTTGLDNVVFSRKTLHALAEVCLLNQVLAEKFFFMFYRHLTDDHLCEDAMKIFFDLLLFYGLEVFGGARNHQGRAANDQSGQREHLAPDQIVRVLPILLSLQSRKLRNIAAMGTCKLFMACRISSAAILSRLILMWHLPETDDQQFLQKVGVFLGTFSQVCPQGQTLLEEAFLPTLAKLRDAPEESSLSKVDQKRVMALFISLTRPGINKFHERKNYRVHNRMAMSLCKKIVDLKLASSFSPVILKSLCMFDLSLEDPSYRCELISVTDKMKKIFCVGKSQQYVHSWARMIEVDESEDLSGSSDETSNEEN